jgi:predicted ATP-dependent protease
LLSDRLNVTAARNAKVALLIALIGSAAVAVIAIVGYLDQSARLAETSDLVMKQDNEIAAQNAILDGQKAELEIKASELAQVQARTDALSEDLAEKEEALRQESIDAGILEAEIKSLNENTALLEAEVSALQSKIQLNELRIQELTGIDSASHRITVPYYGVGVDQNNQGTVFPIKVEIIEPGTGIISVDINNVQYEPGFQSAVRAAAAAASQYSGESISDKDIIVRFAYEDSRFGGELVKVDGSSAGAAIAAMIAAGLSDKEIKSSILVTGSIHEDGTVGRIGSLEEKVIAADTFGAEAMLVPESQEFESNRLAVIGVSDINEIMEHLTS